MKDFNIAKYLKENHLGPHAILGGYVDLHALKEVEDLEGWEQADFGATENKELADRFAKVEKTGNPNKDVKVVKIGKVYKVYTKDIEELKEKKMNSGKNSETITLSYYDYPSISDGDQRFAVKTFIKFVKSLRGNAKVIKDEFEEIEFKLTGISPEEVKDAYAKMVKVEKKRILNPGPFNYLTSWTVNPPGLDEYNQLGEEEEMYLDTEIPYEGPESKVDGFGDEFVQDSPVEEADKGDKDSLMSKLFAIQKKYGYKKARPDQEEYENVRIAPTVARIGNKIVGDGGIAISIESKVSKAAFTDIKNLLQTKFPGWQIDPQSVTKDDDFDTDSKNVLFFDIVKNKSVKEDSVEEVDSMDYDDSVNPFPSLMPDEQGKFDRMMGLIDQSIQPRLGQVKSVIDGAREQGYADRTIFTVLARHPLVKDSIEALVDDGFEFQDIVDFFATDFSQNEEIAGYDAGFQMEGSEEYTVDFGTNTMTYTLDRDNSVLRGLKPGIVPGADREEDIIPVTISPEGYLSTSDRRIKDISPKSNKNPFSDPSYRNID